MKAQRRCVGEGRAGKRGMGSLLEGVVGLLEASWGPFGGLLWPLLGLLGASWALSGA